MQCRASERESERPKNTGATGVRQNPGPPDWAIAVGHNNLYNLLICSAEFSSTMGSPVDHLAARRAEPET